MQQGSINFKIEFKPPCKEEGRSCWVALCPEIDLGTQGDTFEEACSMLKEALEEWFLYYLTLFLTLRLELVRVCGQKFSYTFFGNILFRILFWPRL